MMMLMMMDERTKKIIVLLSIIRIKLMLIMMELVTPVTMIAMEMASRTLRMFVPAIVMHTILHFGT